MINELKPIWVKAIKTEGSWKFFVSDGKPFSIGEGILPTETKGPIGVFWPTYNLLAYYLKSREFTPPPLEYFTTANEDEPTDEIVRRVPEPGDSLEPSVRGPG